MNFIESHKENLIVLCKKHRVKEMYLFGSVLTNDFNDNSDLDFSVIFDRVQLSNPVEFGKNYWSFLSELKVELNRNVDLVIEEGLKNKYFIKELNKTKKLLYAA
jgi:predicted nucleotidyltransferase